MSEITEGVKPTISSLGDLNRERCGFVILFFALICLVGALLVGTFIWAAGAAINVILSVILIAAALARVALVFIFASRIGMQRGALFSFIAFWPVIYWAAFFAVVGFAPDHLKKGEEEPKVVYSLIGWGVIAELWLVPLGLMGLLLLSNPDYASKLFLGPPVGAYMPGLSIPCGWPILALLLVLLSLGSVSSWLGACKRYVRGGWLALLIMLLQVYVIFPSLWIVTVGPAAVQLYKVFTLEQY